MGVRIYQVDAFTAEAFLGNPAAVCILPAQAGEGWMQKVAREMNLSETAFLSPAGDAFDLRWFTPTVEVDLCGHATLAGAHILWEEEHLGQEQEARFYTRSGLLTAKRQAGGWKELNFPSEAAQEAVPPEGLLESLGVEALYVGKNRLDYIVEVESAETLRNMKPDFVGLSKFSARGVIVTSLAGTGDFDFISRYFAPSCGIDEDPVTGSAHCCLGPYWQMRLQKSKLTAFQASQRGGIVKVRLAGERVYLGGQAKTVFKGELLC